MHFKDHLEFNYLIIFLKTHIVVIYNQFVTTISYNYEFRKIIYSLFVINSIEANTICLRQGLR